jgi:tetratricopeptide (TPR) repeat protein
MTEEQSSELLFQRPSTNAEESSDASRIASMLGHLALALDQAAAYIRSRGLSLRNFITEYTARKQRVLEEIPDQWEYCRKMADSGAEQALSVFTPWEMSLDMISGNREEREAKERFLTLAAFFDNKLISKRKFCHFSDSGKAEWMDFLRSENKWDSYKMRDLLAEFDKLSLIQIPHQQADESQFSIHPLVREWMGFRKTQTERQQAVLEIIGALTQYLDLFRFDDQPLAIKRETVSHIDACVLNDRNFCQEKVDVGLKTLPRPQRLFANAYGYQGRYKEARRLCEQAILASEGTTASARLESSRAQTVLAFVCKMESQFEQSEELLKRVLALKEKELGHTNFGAVRTVNQLGNV